jgi:hypothetical protein
MTKYSAVLVELREHRAIEHVLTNFCANLSDDWGIVIFHGSSNRAYIIDLINTKLPQYKQRIVKLINIGVPKFTVEEYAEFLMTIDFHEQIPTETYLLFQTDSYINPKRKDMINDFLAYDYVGTSGLSLRKKSAMMQLIREGRTDLNSLTNIPSPDEAKRFSIRSVYSPIFFGIDAAWKHLYPQLRNMLVRECPEIMKLIQYSPK